MALHVCVCVCVLCCVADIMASLSESDLSAVVDKTAGYSGSDMRNLIQEACQNPIRELNKQHMGSGLPTGLTARDLRPVTLKDFKVSRKRKHKHTHVTQCHRPAHTGAEAHPTPRATEATLCVSVCVCVCVCVRAYMQKAHKNQKPSVTPDEIQRYEEYNRVHGAQHVESDDDSSDEEW